MDHYSLILVTDERSPVRRFQIPKIYVMRAAYAAGAVALVCLLLTWDYWRLRADNSELDGLRIETAEQQEQIDAFELTLANARSELERVRDLERKVRIIANLPGAAAVGGGEVTELVPAGSGGPAGMPILPAGVPIDPEVGTPSMGQGGGDPFDQPLSQLVPVDAATRALTTARARHVHSLGAVAIEIGGIANVRGGSLDKLLVQLDEKRERLENMPSVWPARGWLTSRFGARTSPFTGRTQHHGGLDIAAAHGTDITAPAHGRVSYVGRKGPLGNALVLDHGFGVRTLFGHTSKILVKAGDQVERGQLIAEIGSSGRSTGPHLHYVVEVNGKSRDPLDYIFD
jgi:hypothetical protein